MLFAHSAERFSGNAEFLISSMQAESELRFPYPHLRTMREIWFPIYHRPAFSKSGIHRLPGAIRLRQFPPLRSGRSRASH